MSGGIAWVLDTAGTLEDKMNTGHVRAYPVGKEEADELRRLLSMHEKATGSKKAREILTHFDDNLPKFRTVISDEYKARLEGA